MNVLVTSASRKVGLVRAFKRATAAVGDGRVVAVDISPLAAALYEADGRGTERVADAIQEQVRVVQEAR